ncbi:RDD family protein [Hahella sp. KA22]|uniref:RDD family protein n=1 Tax=Hahella sp. KA22 TaxID=1628392 RepID=UPI000FDE2490|nr:RDD family protein [Hahella sp. KA22]AZZ89873.1 RDD family protein [Hahella sp. KA22]QAY53242.1 RDD family protein [Hahella sp. KA22]
MLDTSIAIETPEGVDFDLTPAGPLSRALAYMADFLIRLGVVLACMIVLSIFGEAGIGISLIIYFVLEWFYPVLFEVYRAATPGKKWMNLIVVHDDGAPITFSSSLLRNLLRTADILPVFYALGLVSMMCNKQFKRLGDIAAGTVVVRARRVETLTALAEPGVRSPSVPLKPEEQKAIVQFAQRAGVLSQARRQELANILEPLHHEKDEAAVVNINQMANYLLGKTPGPEPVREPSAPEPSSSIAQPPEERQ